MEQAMLVDLYRSADLSQFLSLVAVF